VASGRERRRNLSEETDNDYSDTVAALGLAVLAAVAIGIALATPNLPNIGTIYVTVT
jgi:hypothetical protein